MVIRFMVSRNRRSITLSVLVAAVALLSVACEKVPLLAPAGSTITITSAAATLPINGTAQILAQIVEGGGTPPHSGTRVTFTTTLGRFDPPDVDTDVTGRAVTTFIAGTSSGVAAITAISGGIAVTAANAIQIRIGAAAVGGVGLAASPATLPATGGTTLLTAIVSDPSGNALPGVPVSFAIDTTAAGGTGSFSATVATTDGNGRATTQFTTNRTTTVTATAGVATSTGGGGTGTPPPTTTSAQTAKVIVNVNTTASITAGTVTPNPAVVNQTVTVPLTYAAATAASPVVRVTVDWGDGAVATITGQPPAVSHSYSRQGSFLVVITGTDALGDTTTTSTSITVQPRPQPIVAITAAPSTGIQANTPVTFTATVTQGTTGATTQSVTWSFSDDGSTFTLQGNSLSIVHIFARDGIFVVTATVTDSTGATGTSQLPVIVGNGGVPGANFTVTPAAPKVNQTVSFDATSSSGSIVNYTFDFGDGTLGQSGSSPFSTHVFTSAATFNVRLTVTDSSGRSFTKTIPVTVTT